MTTTPPTTPESDNRPGISPLVWGVIVVVLVLGIGAVIAVAANDDDETIDLSELAEDLPPPSETAPPTVPIPETAPPAEIALPETCDATAPVPGERPTVTTPEMQIDPAKTYAATLATSCGDIVIALDAANAPTSVNNFVALARAGFYDGLPWHRVAPGFVIQGGDPNGDGSGGPDYKVQSEPPPQGAYAQGDVAWAKSEPEAAGTAGSQFFIVTGDASTLPAEYGFIGTVSIGLENAQTIETLGSADGPPAIPVYILAVTITET
ncbi:MAG: peptidylprolyl isomerase [Actinomycetota bacterium]